MKTSTTKILFGLTGIMLGIAFLGTVFGFWDFRELQGWWALLLIIPALGSMVSSKINLGNIIVLFLGIWFLLREQKWLQHRDVDLFVLSLLLIVIGLWLILSDYRRKRRYKKYRDANVNIDTSESYNDESFNGEAFYEKKEPKNSYGDVDSNNFPRYLALFSDGQHVNSSQCLRGASATAAFGNVLADFFDAVVEKSIVVEGNAVFGKSTIIIPQNIRIEVDGFALFGSVNNRVPPEMDMTLPLVKIKYLSLFGEVEIRNR